jgi:hypothetical protein
VLGSIVTFVGTGSALVYFFDGVKEARRSVIRFTRTALTVGIRL